MHCTHVLHVYVYYVIIFGEAPVTHNVASPLGDYQYAEMVDKFPENFVIFLEMSVIIHENESSFGRFAKKKKNVTLIQMR